MKLFNLSLLLAVTFQCFSLASEVKVEKAKTFLSALHMACFAGDVFATKAALKMHASLKADLIPKAIQELPNAEAILDSLDALRLSDFTLDEREILVSLKLIKLEMLGDLLDLADCLDELRRSDENYCSVIDRFERSIAMQEYEFTGLSPEYVLKGPEIAKTYIAFSGTVAYHDWTLLSPGNAYARIRRRAELFSQIGNESSSSGSTLADLLSTIRSGLLHIDPPCAIHLAHKAIVAGSVRSLHIILEYLKPVIIRKELLGLYQAALGARLVDTNSRRKNDCWKAFAPVFHDDSFGVHLLSEALGYFSNLPELIEYLDEILKSGYRPFSHECFSVLTSRNLIDDAAATKRLLPHLVKYMRANELGELMEAYFSSEKHDVFVTLLEATVKDHNSIMARLSLLSRDFSFIDGLNGEAYELFLKITNTPDNEVVIDLATHINIKIEEMQKILSVIEEIDGSEDSVVHALSEGATAQDILLTAAVMDKSFEMIDIALKGGARLDVVDPFSGQSVLELACNKDVRKYLQQKMPVVLDPFNETETEAPVSTMPTVEVIEGSEALKNHLQAVAEDTAASKLFMEDRIAEMNIDDITEIAYYYSDSGNHENLSSLLENLRYNYPMTTWDKIKILNRFDDIFLVPDFDKSVSALASYLNILGNGYLDSEEVNEMTNEGISKLVNDYSKTLLDSLELLEQLEIDGLKSVEELDQMVEDQGIKWEDLIVIAVKQENLEVLEQAVAQASKPKVRDPITGELINNSPTENEDIRAILASL